MREHDKMMAALKRAQAKPKEANFAFSGDFEDDPPEEAANYSQCDCCGNFFPEDDIAFIRFDALGNSAGCDTYACPKCRGEPGYTDAEIERSQARIAAVLGPDEVAKLDAEAVPVAEEQGPELPWCDGCRRQFGAAPKDRNIEKLCTATVFTCDACLEAAAQERYRYRPGPICGRDY